VTGEWLRQAGWLNPSKSISQVMETGGRIHQFLWQWSHTASNATQELSGEERKKPFQAESISSSPFQAWANRSYPEGNRLLLCISTGRMTLAVLMTRPAQRKTLKGGTK